ncbi:MAG TPA: hypothetical protein VM866_11250, partial [Pyrinomonadaceae bacterium]|nr:hypothetical protein [Pyrinomonadaceae bacterium]
RLREARGQVDDLVKRVGESGEAKPVIEAGKSLSAKLTAIEEELYQTKNQSSQDPLNYPIRLNNKLAALAGVVASADAAPTAQSVALYEELTAKIDAQLSQLDQIMRADLRSFNALVREQNIPAVTVKGTSGGSR